MIGENETNSESGEENVSTVNDYISAINEMKKTTVKRSEYDKILEENRALLKSIVDGSAEQQSEPPQKEVNVEELRKDLFSKDLSNLEYAKKALELRKALIEKEGIQADPFVPHGQNITAEDEDYRKANKVADYLQNCIDKANGNPDIFSNEFQRNLIDSAPMYGRR